MDLDARRFARLAAAHAAVERLERERSLGFDLAALDSICPSAEPTNEPFHLERSRIDAPLAAERGAQPLFIGYAGDQLFYQELAAWGSAGFLQRRGLRVQLLLVALDAARIDQRSLWQVLAVAACEALGGQRCRPPREAVREA